MASEVESRRLPDPAATGTTTRKLVARPPDGGRREVAAEIRSAGLKREPVIAAGMLMHAIAWTPAGIRAPATQTGAMARRARPNSMAGSMRRQRKLDLLATRESMASVREEAAR